MLIVKQLVQFISFALPHVNRSKKGLKF